MGHPLYAFTLYQLLNFIIKLPDEESEDVYSVLGLPQTFTMTLRITPTLHVSSSLTPEQGLWDFIFS